MPSSLVSADSLLAIDVGASTTRALLFDVVDGRYRFLAAGSAVTTANAPFKDIGEGVRRALDQLAEISGRLLLRDDGSIIIPSSPDGSGVDALVATISLGEPLKVIALGLLEDVSLESARRLAATTYTTVIETLSLNDRRKQDARIDLILRTRPDLVIAAGGTEGGADRSIKELLETVGLACRLMPKDGRPQVLFVGNKAIHKDIRAMLGKATQLHYAPNIRPALEMEDLNAAQMKLAKIYQQIYAGKVLGVQELNDWTGGNLLPTATAFGRMIRFLSRLYDPAKGVLGVDMGASASTVIAGFGGNLFTGVYPEFGMGHGLPGILKYTSPKRIARWLTVDLSPEDVRDYIYYKAAYPTSIPATDEELSLEQAILRETLRLSMRKLAVNFPPNATGPNPGVMPWFEPILVRGRSFTNAPSPGRAMLSLLDGLQPTGVTTILLDQSELAAALGAAAAVNPALVVQVLETNMQNLGAVISPVGNARLGTPILRLQATLEDGSEQKMEVKYGTIEVLSVPLGQTVTLRLQPLHRFDIGMGGPGRGGQLRVVGGVLGVVIDARGRPVILHHDPEQRRKLFGKWIWMLGG
jgi:hypothetical protein